MITEYKMLVVIIVREVWPGRGVSTWQWCVIMTNQTSPVQPVMGLKDSFSVNHNISDIFHSLHARSPHSMKSWVWLVNFLSSVCMVQFVQVSSRYSGFLLQSKKTSRLVNWMRSCRIDSEIHRYLSWYIKTSHRETVWIRNGLQSTQESRVQSSTVNVHCFTVNIHVLL